MAGLLPIGEFARRSGLSISALRFYGDAGVLAPAHTDPLSGYRYYSADQLPVAAVIRHLRTAEVPLDQVRALLTVKPADAEAGLREHRTRLRARLGQVTVSSGDAQKVARNVADASTVSFSLRDGLVVHADEQTIRLGAAADDYPNYEAVLARCGNSKLIVKTADLVKVLDRSKELVVLIVSRSTTMADGVPFPAEYDGEDLTIGFNSSYLADALEAGIGPDAIFQLGSGVDPAAIRSADGGTLTWMVMPIRLLEKAASS